MYGFWGFIILLAGILLQALLHNTGRIQSDYCLWFFIFVSAYFFINDLSLQFPKRMRYVVASAAVVRFLIMLWNVYGRDIYLLPNVGQDTEGFFYSASMISQNLDLLNVNVYGTYYSKYLGIIFHLTGPSYLLGSYLNYVYGLLVIRFVNDIVQSIVSPEDTAYIKSMYIFAFAPMSMILFSSLRREAIMILFAVLSIKMLFQWIEAGKKTFAVLSVVFLLFSSLFHAGMIGIFLGYAFLFLFYNPKSRSISFDIKTIVAGVLLSLLVVIIVAQYSSLFLQKLMFANEDALYYQLATKARGGAVYLDSVRITGISDIVLYSPLKIFYFLLSPVPWDWRGLQDVMAFALDSLIYLYLIVLLIRRYSNVHYPAKLGLVLAFLGCLEIFAIGSQNAGTAIRHRCKLLPLLIVLYCILKTNNYTITKKADNYKQEEIVYESRL